VLKHTGDADRILAKWAKGFKRGSLVVGMTALKKGLSGSRRPAREQTSVTIHRIRSTRTPRKPAIAIASALT
jgi:hypothetical protein